MSLLIQNNNGPVYNECTVTIFQGETREESRERDERVSDERVSELEEEFALPIPEEGKYSKVREYIAERKRFDEEFKNYCLNHSLRDLCTRLTKEFGWFVDENSLQRNLNRNR